MTVNNPAIDNLVESSLESENENLRLEWIPYEEITNVKPTQIDNVYCAIRDYYEITLVYLGKSKECTPTLVSEFARRYSLPTHKYNNKYNNNDNDFKRYSVWLQERNELIKGFTKSNDDNYYMVAHKRFYHCYSRYGFCSTCGILRCSPVWCICSYKQLSDGWTSNNHQLDDFIKKSQLQTNSPNDAYLEWIPFDCIYVDRDGNVWLWCLPTSFQRVRLTPLEITDETHDSYYAELCDKHQDILNTDIWVTIGFTYDTKNQKYYLIKEAYDHGLCLACTKQISPKINLFCCHCGALRLPDWTTGTKSLDSFIMESWSNMENEYDAYIQWLEYSLLTNVQEMASLRHGCTHIADWLEPTADKSTSVTLKRIVGGQNAQQFDFYQLSEEYPEMLTPENIWIIGIAQEPSTREYYLVFYRDVHAILDKFIRLDERVLVKYMRYSDFNEVKEIGSGGYGTVYTANYSKYSEEEDMEETVVLKRFKSFDTAPELFISEFRNHAKCALDTNVPFLKVYGYTQDPEIKDYLIVMQYANNGSLMSYLDQNINKLTWRMKLEQLRDIADYLSTIHIRGLVHCDLHGGNIVMHNNNDNMIMSKTKSLICDLGLSQSVNSHKSNLTVQGVLPFVAPEVFHTCKFTQKSDIYSFGIIMYLVATGEPPFRDRQFDRGLVCDILGGLRPLMPDSAPEGYKKLAEWCCDADPDKRPDRRKLWEAMNKLRKVYEDDSDGNTWNAIYHNNVKALSRLEKESRYSSKLLPTGDLPKPRNSYDMDSAAVTQTQTFFE